MKNILFISIILFTSVTSFESTWAYEEKDTHQSSLMTHEDHSKHGQKESEPSIKLMVQKIEDKGDKKIVQIKLIKATDGTPVGLDSLKELHTQKIHLLIIEDGLQDYSHIHPKALKETGVYEFEWHPKKSKGNYRIWADLFPLDTNQQEYIINDLTSHNQKSKIDKTIVYETKVNGHIFKLSFDTNELQAGKASMGKIIVTDSKGNLIKDLEPIMGAFAHIVGFADDFRTVVHIHPMGEEPSKSTDRGGPELEFHINPEKVGFIKLFAQLTLKGKELFVPFGIKVK